MASVKMSQIDLKCRYLTRRLDLLNKLINHENSVLQFTAEERATRGAKLVGLLNDRDSAEADYKYYCNSAREQELQSRSSTS